MGGLYSNDYFGRGIESNEYTFFIITFTCHFTFLTLESLGAMCQAKNVIGSGLVRVRLPGQVALLKKRSVDPHILC